MIDLRTLGALDLRRRDGPELHSVLAQPKRTALLVYLALARPHGFHRRDVLAGLFWSEHDTEHARNNLRQAVHFLRRSLGDEAIVSRGDEDIGVADGVLRCDAVQFEVALDAGEAERALRLYGGDLLPGFFVEEAPEFDHWLEGERTRLRERAVRGCWSLAEAKERAGETAAAAEWGRRAVEIAPADDTQIMRLMQLLARAGDRSGALAAFEAYTRRLRTELEVEPTEPAAALAAEIRNAPPTRPERQEAQVPSRIAAAEAADLPPAARVAPAPVEPQLRPPAVISSARQAAAPLPEQSLPGQGASSGEWVARALWRSSAVGALVGMPVALLSVGLAHALRPRTVPVIEASVLFGAAGLLLVAMLAAWVMRRPGAHVAARRHGRVGAGVGFTLGCLVALSAVYTLAPRQPRPSAPPSGAMADTGRRRVTVTRFANLTGEAALEPIGRLAEDWVVRRLRTIPETEVVAIAANTEADTSLDAVTALARRTGADLVLFGRYYRDGEDVLLAASLVPPRGGRIPSEITGMAIGPVAAPRARPLGGIDRLASIVAGAVAAGCRVPGCLPGRRAPMYEARQLYVEAMEAQDRGDWVMARQKFRQASQLDTTFVNAYTHLAQVSGCAQGDSIGEILEARRQEFGLYDLLYMRIMRAACRNDGEAMYQLRRQQLELAPEDPSTRAGVAATAFLSGRLREAEARYRAGPLEAAGGQPALDYSRFTYVLHLEGKIAEELRVAAEGRLRLAEDPSAPILGLRGLAALGRTQELEARVHEARRAGATLLTVAQMYYSAALELEWHGHAEAARQFALRAVRELDRAPPAEPAHDPYLPVRAIMLLELQRWGEARQLAEAGGARDPFLLTVRGLASAGAADKAAARAALAALRALPDSTFRGQPTREQGQAAVLAALGQKDEALRRLEDGQARKTLPRSGPYITHAVSYFGPGGDLLQRLWHDPRFERMFAARD